MSANNEERSAKRSKYSIPPSSNSSSISASSSIPPYIPSTLPTPPPPIIPKSIISVPFELDVRSASSSKPAIYSQPKLIGTFSLDPNGKISTPGSPRRFKAPSLPYNLNSSIDRFVPKHPLDSSLPSRPYFEALQSLSFPVSSSTTHFVTFRNNLNKIMSTPFEDKEGWIIAVARENDIIYLDVRESQSKHKFGGGPPEAWGYIFEDACTASDSKGEGKIDPNEEWCALISASLDEHKLLICAEIDCIEKSDGALELSKFVEIKTSRIIEHPGQAKSFERFKLLKFWIQSFLVGVSKIFVAFRDDAGVVKQAQMMNTHKLPSFGSKYWNPDACLRVTSSVLTMLKERTENGVKYLMSYDPAAAGGPKIYLKRGEDSLNVPTK